jgi:hypothetical protein
MSKRLLTAINHSGDKAMNHITGTTLSSASKLRVVLLLSLLLCAFAQQSVRSQDGAAPLRDDARPRVIFPCPRPEAQIEPQAGKWKTWVLSSGRQLKIPPPPHRAASEKEIGVLKQLSFERDAAALDLINFWDAGSPSFRWNEFALGRIIKNNIGNPRAPRILSYVHVAIYDAMVSAWRWKYLYNRTRPSALNRSLITVLPNPNSPSYPSEHAVAAGAASAVLAFFFPTDAEFFMAKADGIRHAPLARMRWSTLLTTMRRSPAGTQSILIGRSAPINSTLRSRLCSPTPIIRATRRRTLRSPRRRPRCWPIYSRATPDFSRGSRKRRRNHVSGRAFIIAATCWPGWLRPMPSPD